MRFSQASVDEMDGSRPRSFLKRTARWARSFASSGERLVRLAAIAAATCFKLSSLIVLARRSEEHTSELQSLMRISYAVFCLKKKTKITPVHVILNQAHTNWIHQTLKIQSII